MSFGKPKGMMDMAAFEKMVAVLGLRDGGTACLMIPAWKIDSN